LGEGTAKSWVAAVAERGVTTEKNKLLITKTQTDFIDTIL